MLQYNFLYTTNLFKVTQIQIWTKIKSDRRICIPLFTPLFYSANEYLNAKTDHFFVNLDKNLIYTWRKT